MKFNRRKLITSTMIPAVAVTALLIMSHTNNEQHAKAQQLIDEHQLDTSATDFIYQTGRVDGPIGGDLDKHASEQEIIAYMHKMTHQKIRSREKKGAVEMTFDHIMIARTALNNNEDIAEDRKKELASILDKWRKKDFSKIDYMHDILNQLEGGTIGESTGIMSQQEEELFVENNFR